MAGKPIELIYTFSFTEVARAHWFRQQRIIEGCKACDVTASKPQCCAAQNLQLELAVVPRPWGLVGLGPSP